jgi:iron uptake system component EfeO
MPSTRQKLLALGAIGELLLVVIGLGVILVTKRTPQKPVSGGQVEITITGSACAPNEVTLAAGAADFAIHNASSRAIEWELLDGVMVLAERENIAPGFTVEVTPRLEPGTYQMTCGLLSNPRGTLTVTAADGSTTAAATAPTLADLIAPTAEYRVYAITSADELVAATIVLAAAVKSGDIATAKARAADGLAAFAHMAPIAHLFANSASALGTGPASLPALAKSIATAPGTGDLGAAADAVAAAAQSLSGRAHMTTAAPHEIVAGAGTAVAALGGGVEDPRTAAATIAGVRKVADLFRPLTLRADKALAAKLDTDLTTAETAFATPGVTATPALKAQLADLGADFTALLAALGLTTPQEGQ